MKSYASRIGNLAALRSAGWGLFVSAAGVQRQLDLLDLLGTEEAHV